MDYNLVRNSQLSYDFFNSSRVFSTTEISYIDDNDMSFEKSIQVSGTESLWFLSDFNKRIKIDEVRLYLYSSTASGTVLDGINFYYKDYTEDSYTLITDKYIGNDNFYYGKVPYPSAPIEVKTTISGITCNISEYFISNDDYAVGFGEDGNLNKKYITRSDDANRTQPQTVAIYNRNVNGVNELTDAYICVEYTGEIGDNYLKISTDSNGGYIGIDDGVLIEGNNITSDYQWEMGSFYNTKIDVDKLILDAIDLDYMRGTVPHPDSTSTRLNWGPNCFAKDEVEKVLYIVVPDYYLKLYRYDYFLDTWEFIGKINPGCNFLSLYASSGAYSIAKMGNYIYVLLNYDGEFGRYDLNGSENNWEVLQSINIITPVHTYDKYTLCGDLDEYIYTINSKYSGDSIDSSFAKYSTISGSVAGWEPLSGGYDHSQSSYVHISFTYDNDHNCFYYFNGINNGSTKVQKYDINSNTWNKEWLDPFVYSPYSYTYHMSYLNNYLYILVAGELCKYNVELFNFEVIQQIVDDVYTLYYNQQSIVILRSVFDEGDNLDFLWIGTNIQRYYNLDRMFSYNNELLKGSYKTPIFNTSDGNEYSYFLIDCTLENNTNVTFNLYNTTNTMRLRSSNISPIPLEKLFYVKSSKLSSINLFTDGVDSDECNSSMNGYNFSENHVYDYAIDRRTGYRAISYKYASSTQHGLDMYDYEGNLKERALDDYPESNSDHPFMLDIMTFDNNDGIWGYCSSEKIILHFSSTFSFIAIVTAEDEGVSSYGFGQLLSYMCAGYSASLWYIQTARGKLRHLDTHGNLITETVLDEPMMMVSNGNGGVWILHKDNKEIIKYAENHDVELVITLTTDVLKMASDLDGGLWFSHESILRYTDSSGTATYSVEISADFTSIEGGHSSCIVYSDTVQTAYYVKLNEGVVKEIVLDEAQPLGVKFFSYGNDDMFESKTNLLPVSYDPYWGNSGNIEWEEVQLNGYFLDKVRYYQLELTLKTSSASTTPTVNKINLVPGIKLVDIPKGGFKNIYVKLDVPTDERNQTYNTKLKCWWEDKE